MKIGLSAQNWDLTVVVYDREQVFDLKKVRLTHLA